MPVCAFPPMFTFHAWKANGANLVALYNYNIIFVYSLHFTKSFIGTKKVHQLHFSNAINLNFYVLQHSFSSPIPQQLWLQVHATYHCYVESYSVKLPLNFLSCLQFIHTCCSYCFHLSDSRNFHTFVKS